MIFYFMRSHFYFTKNTTKLTEETPLKEDDTQNCNYAFLGARTNVRIIQKELWLATVMD